MKLKLNETEIRPGKPLRVRPTEKFWDSTDDDVNLQTGFIISRSDWQSKSHDLPKCYFLHPNPKLRNRGFYFHV